MPRKSERSQRTLDGDKKDERERFTKTLSDIDSAVAAGNPTLALARLYDLAWSGAMLRAKSFVKDKRRRSDQLLEELANLTPEMTLTADSLLEERNQTVEGSRCAVVFTLGNNRPQGRSGWVTGRVLCSQDCRTPSLRQPIGLYEIDVPGFSSNIGVIDFVAPPAGTSHTLELLYYDKASNPATPAARTTYVFDSAAAYAYVVDGYHVNETRSLVRDTNSATWGATWADGSDSYPGLGKNETKVSNGDDITLGEKPCYFYAVPSSVDYIVLWYLILNSTNHISDRESSRITSNIAAAFSPVGLLFSLVWGTDDNHFDDDYDPRGFEIAAIFGGMFFILIFIIPYEILKMNCDGPVAKRAVGFDGKDLESQTRNTQSISFRHTDLGEDSAVGCGPNSNYEVTYSITRLTSKPFTIWPKVVRIRSGESIQFFTSPVIDKCFWSCDNGQIDGTGLFTAPAVSADTLVRIEVYQGASHFVPSKCVAAAIVSP